MARPRDATKSRLYAAEDGARWPEVARRPLAVPGEAEAWARRIFNRQAVRRRFPALLIAAWRKVHVVRDRRLRTVAADANKYRNRIRVSDATVTPHLLVHELAHLLTPLGAPAHGREFRQAYLTLVRYALGPESARALRAAFKKAGLPYRPYRARPALKGRRPGLAQRVATTVTLEHIAVPTLS